MSMIAAPRVNEEKDDVKLSSSSSPRLVSTRKARRTLPAPDVQMASSDFSSPDPAGSRLMLVVQVAVCGATRNGGPASTPPPAALKRLRDSSSIIGAPNVGLPDWV